MSWSEQVRTSERGKAARIDDSESGGQQARGSEQLFYNPLHCLHRSQRPEEDSERRLLGYGYERNAKQ